MRLVIISVILILCFATTWSEQSLTDRKLFDEDTFRLIAKLTYSDTAIRARVLYRYNEMGRLIETVMDDGTSEDPFSPEGVKGRLITQIIPHPAADDDDHPLEVTETFHDVETGEVTLMKQITNAYSHDLVLIKRVIRDLKGNTVESEFGPRGKLLSVLENPVEGTPRLTTLRWEENGKLFEVIQQEVEAQDDSTSEEPEAATHNTLYSRVESLLNRFFPSTYDRTADWTWRQDFESIAVSFLGPDTFRRTGYYVYPAIKGSYGQGEVSDKVRITFINGIQNHPEVRMDHLRLFSRIHGGCNIHFILRAYEGWTRDMLRSIPIKVGFLSEYAKSLAATWKRMIAEMGGVEGGGLIIHYSHSIGGADTDNARQLMTPEELKMIRVYNFGSPMLIHEGHFGNVINYVSHSDYVSMILSPVEFFVGSVNPHSNVVFLNSGSLWPDHLLTDPTYRTVLERLGDEFIEKHIKTSDHSLEFTLD